MKHKLLTMLMAGVMVAGMALQALAAEYVYVTQYGKRYHHADSRFIQGKDNVERITKAEAEERGLKPVSGYEASADDIEEEAAQKK